MSGLLLDAPAIAGMLLTKRYSSKFASGRLHLPAQDETRATACSSPGLLWVCSWLLNDGKMSFFVFLYWKQHSSSRAPQDF